MARWRNRAELDDFAHRYTGDQIRMLAGKQGIDLKTLASEAGISEAGLHRILAGERSPTLRSLAGLAAVLRCAPADLVP